MAAPTEDFTKPDFSNAVTTDIDQIRDNFETLMMYAGGQGYVLPNWTTTVNSSSSPQDFSEPDDITMTHSDGRKMRWTLTWTSGKVTQIVWEFDRGVAESPTVTWETLTGGTCTLSYDGSGNFTGVTTA